jgi:hypothetical protein
MQIRIWRLGSIEHKILPTPQAIRKFKRMLKNELRKTYDSEPALDIVWGPELSVTVIDTGGNK